MSKRSDPDDTPMTSGAPEQPAGAPRPRSGKRKLATTAPSMVKALQDVALDLYTGEFQAVPAGEEQIPVAAVTGRVAEPADEVDHQPTTQPKQRKTAERVVSRREPVVLPAIPSTDQLFGVDRDDDPDPSLWRPPRRGAWAAAVIGLIAGVAVAAVLALAGGPSDPNESNTPPPNRTSSTEGGSLAPPSPARPAQASAAVVERAPPILRERELVPVARGRRDPERHLAGAHKPATVVRARRGATPSRKSIVQERKERWRREQEARRKARIEARKALVEAGRRKAQERTRTFKKTFNERRRQRLEATHGDDSDL